LPQPVAEQEIGTHPPPRQSGLGELPAKAVDPASGRPLPEEGRGESPIADPGIGPDELEHRIPERDEPVRP
jgi:hypothetical protein